MIGETLEEGLRLAAIEHVNLLFKVFCDAAAPPGREERFARGIDNLIASHMRAEQIIRRQLADYST